jgi:starvation-inducible DNA-binding protein
MNTRNGKTGEAAPALATPTDLKPNEVENVRKALNPLIADAFALYIKSKNFHWHLAGKDFRDYHLLLDEQATSILASIDPLAERLRRIGATTLRSVSHISREQTLKDDEDEFVPVDQMIARLLEDNRSMAEAQRAAIEVCEENRDTPTGNVLQEILDETEKRIWFLFEMTQGGWGAQEGRPRKENAQEGVEQAMPSPQRAAGKAAAGHRR